jgi:Flp pilus assembly protein TadB
MTVIAMLLGAGVAAGILLIAHGITPTAMPARPPRWRLSRPDTIRLAGSLVAAALAGLVTRWPVGAVLAGAATWLLPKVLGADRHHHKAMARSDAVASFSEMLRDNLAAAAGLEQAILAAADVAPQAILTEVRALAADVRSGVRLSDALARFRTAMNDPVADLVVAALHQAAQRQASRLAELLTTLAAIARRATTVRLRVVAARARVRTSARVVTVTTLAMAVGLAILNRAYLAPYSTLLGQLILVAVGALFALGFLGLARLGRDPRPPENEGARP